jgi:hypothetical protein
MIAPKWALPDKDGGFASAKCERLWKELPDTVI